jgi:AcrR family transcriptional regulator
MTMTKSDLSTNQPSQDVGSQPPAPPRRADAQRNRARLLAAAREAFVSDGYHVPIDEIARRAGVGAGTVYRHFPTKEALFEAVVLDLISQLTAEGRALLGAAEQGMAFLPFLSRVIVECAAHKGLADALAQEHVDFGAAVAPAKEELLAILGHLLVHAQEAGEVRSDVAPHDIDALLNGLLAMEQHRDTRTPLGHLAAIVYDGLRRS